MLYIYIYEGPFVKGDKGWKILKASAKRFFAERKLPYDMENVEIRRSEKGKPFFEDTPVEFSISHSGIMWMCLFSEKPCGLDLQEVESGRDWQAISRRYYTAEEQHYVELWGIEGFYDVWVRKEAFGKCIGQGFFADMPSMVDEETELRMQVKYEDTDYFFQEISLIPKIKCVACVLEREPIELRILG